jgi:hypothetical protein
MELSRHEKFKKPYQKLDEWFNEKCCLHVLVTETHLYIICAWVVGGRGGPLPPGQQEQT